MTTRPRGDSLREVLLKTTAPVRLVRDDAPRPLDELVESWRLAAVGGDEARPCACGTAVVANALDPVAGVRQHQATDRHRRWSRRTYELG